jgi:hypothetical protein
VTFIIIIVSYFILNVEEIISEQVTTRVACNVCFQVVDYKGAGMLDQLVVRSAIIDERRSLFVAMHGECVEIDSLLKLHKTSISEKITIDVFRRIYDKQKQF